MSRDVLYWLCIVGIAAFNFFIGWDSSQRNIERDCQTMEQFRVGERRYACVKVQPDTPARPSVLTPTGA